MELLQIILHQDCNGCTTGGNSFWWDVSKDFILPVCLGITAAVVAWVIFVGETKRDRKKEQNAELQSQINNLHFFLNVSEKILKMARQQVVYMNDLVKKVKETPRNTPLLTFLPLHDVRRLSHETALEKYMHAYIAQFNEKREILIIEFNNIVSSVDYFLDVFTMLRGEMERSVKADFERKNQLKKIFDLANEAFGLILEDKSFDGKIKNDLLAIGDHFYRGLLKNNLDAIYYHNNYFTPFFNYFIGLKPEKMNKLLLDFGAHLRDGLSQYGLIVDANLQMAEEIVSQIKGIEKVISLLDKSLDRIRQKMNISV